LAAIKSTQVEGADIVMKSSGNATPNSPHALRLVANYLVKKTSLRVSTYHGESWRTSG